MLIILSVSTYRCAVEISLWGSLGVLFGILGEHFGSIWHPMGRPLGILGAFWRRVEFW